MCQFCGGELEALLPAVIGGGGLAFLSGIWYWLKNKLKRRYENQETKEGGDTIAADNQEAKKSS